MKMPPVIKSGTWKRPGDDRERSCKEDVPIDTGI
jgi:hypothetical protein